MRIPNTRIWVVVRHGVVVAEISIGSPKWVTVMPAKAGIQKSKLQHWMPAFAGMTKFLPDEYEWILK